LEWEAAVKPRSPSGARVSAWEIMRRKVPRVASEIARRLLEAGRVTEAWSAINAVNESRPGWIPFEWEEMRLNVMEALGNKDEAQVFRWHCFERALNSAHLRAYLKRLPDFDDLETEERAMSCALRFPKHSWCPGPRWIRPRPS
jgi:hypothetical protein